MGWHGTSLDHEIETETKYRPISRLETETETQEMPETRPRRESRLVSVREMVETESLADPWYVDPCSSGLDLQELKKIFAHGPKGGPH